LAYHFSYGEILCPGFLRAGIPVTVAGYYILPKMNPAASLASAQFGSAAMLHDDYRLQQHPSENINLRRTWRFKEQMTLNLRIEFANIFHCARYHNSTYANPTTSVTRNALGNLSNGLGYISIRVRAD
jgi:hypothetical protein